MVAMKAGSMAALMAAWWAGKKAVSMAVMMVDQRAD
jgi:hypothetical protein